MKNKELQLLDELNNTIEYLEALMPLLKRIKWNLTKGKTKFNVKVKADDVNKDIIEEIAKLGFDFRKIGEYHYIFGKRKLDFEYEVTLNLDKHNKTFNEKN